MPYEDSNNDPAKCAKRKITYEEIKNRLINLFLFTKINNTMLFF